MLQEWKAASSVALSTGCVFMLIPLWFTEGEREQGSKHHTNHKEGPGEKPWNRALRLAHIEGFCLMWNSTVRKTEMPISSSVVLRLSGDLKPGLPQMNFHGDGSLTAWETGYQKYVFLKWNIWKYMLWNKEKLWIYLTGTQPIQCILTASLCIRSRSNAPHLPKCLCHPYHIRNNHWLKGLGLYVAPFCHGGALVSAKDFIMLQPFTGEGSNEMSFLHPTTFKMKYIWT